MIKRFLLWAAVTPAIMLAVALSGKSEPAQYSAQDRARWECSARIKAKAYLPDSLEWVRRSQWPAVQRGEAWHVVATFEATNRIGARVQGQRTCEVKL